MFCYVDRAEKRHSGLQVHAACTKVGLSAVLPASKEEMVAMTLLICPNDK